MARLQVYIALCSDGSFYTGVTNNIERRIEEHNKGLNHSAYTYPRKPVKLVWASEKMEELYAISWEKKIKGWSHAKKQALIDGDFDKLPELSRNRQRK
jgi:putative endonuclease